MQLRSGRFPPCCTHLSPPELSGGTSLSTAKELDEVGCVVEANPCADGADRQFRMHQQTLGFQCDTHRNEGLGTDAGGVEARSCERAFGACHRMRIACDMVPLVKVCIDQRPKVAETLRYTLRPVGRSRLIMNRPGF